MDSTRQQTDLPDSRLHMEISSGDAALTIPAASDRFRLYDSMLEARKVNVLGLFFLLIAAFFVGAGVHEFSVNGGTTDFVFFIGLAIIIYAADFAAFLHRMKKEEA